nr:immunoglobulin light chain junction region [Homo sapiens]MCC53308.1 immunoglobulin light chain junction region [Homo sapiens]MCC53310.1 immunoglobulin light chain junction region [Homo sapiens]MCD62630.1 immunoglobulin light chain junction region [Homo sapiens]
CQQYDTLTF